MEFFGFQFTRKKEPQLNSVVPPSSDDGSTVVGGNAAGYYAQSLDLEASVKNENEAIRRYRDAAMYPDCDSAIEDIVNEAISAEDLEHPVEIVLDEVPYSEAIKAKIRSEFQTILTLYNFEEKAHDMFRTWYIDGRLYYNVLFDPKRPKDGIQEIRYIDPRKIRKVKNVTKKKLDKNIEVVTGVEEYYLYNDKGLSDNSSIASSTTPSGTTGVKLSNDSVIYTPSGITDGVSGTMLGYLHKAVKPVNQLKMIEDSIVIYRISRAPERRVFYVDVGNLPKLKAEQYVTDIMNKYRNKITYDATTGQIANGKRHNAITEDYWMPRREGGKGTEITTLSGGQNLSNLEDVQHFQQKLYQSLNVPMGRMVPSTGFSLGKSSEISRDEIKFSKFISRLRKKFSKLLSDTLRIQLISKGIITPDDWEQVKTFIKFDFVSDNHFAELKQTEIIGARIQTLQMIEPFIGKFYSVPWVKKNVLMMNDAEVQKMTQEMEVDQLIQDPALQPTPLEQNLGALQSQGEQDAAQHQAALDMDLQTQAMKAQRKLKGESLQNELSSTLNILKE